MSNSVTATVLDTSTLNAATFRVVMQQIHCLFVTILCLLFLSLQGNEFTKINFPAIYLHNFFCEESF